MSGQEEAMAFLGSPAAFGGTGPVERLDTHGAVIFLSGDAALKLKRAVRYDYMDLSTPEKRRTLLERELELNAPAAPTIYREVLPVTRGPEGLRLGGEGEALDWVLRMRRFRAEDELEAVAERGALDGALADEIGRMVARYHEAAPVREEAGARLIGEILDELGRVFADFPGAAGMERVSDWSTASRAALAAAAPLLDARGRGGHVRRGHGDLHLRNIVLVEGRPVPFDALEFDERLGTCDVLYDLGFLLMDLLHRGLGAAACRALSEYLLAARGREDAGLAALPLFLSARAAIRAMVLLQTDAARGRAGASAAEIGAYLGEAMTALAPRPARLVAVSGFSGTGKTVLARALAPGLGAKPGAVHLSTDLERKAARGLDATERLSGAAYSEAARGEVYAALIRRAETILRAGHSVVIDGAFLESERRHEVERLAARLGVPAAFFWLAAPQDVLEARVAGRKGDASDADLSVLRRQFSLDLGEMRWRRLDASGTPEETAGAARAALDP